MTRASRALVLMAALLMALSLYMPVWGIALDAPQYPEGLGLRIWFTDITGATEHDLAKINNLNHYIGMKKILPEEIPELKILPGAVTVLISLASLAAVAGSRRALWVWLVAFTLFAAAGMADFYYWGYDYGHDLDPSAPIKVPGMSYQPPLIGSKKLLNFTATSLPSWGTFAMALAYALGLVALYASYAASLAPEKAAAMAGFVERHVRSPRWRRIVFACLFLSGCLSSEPREVRLGEDSCSACRMVIGDSRFAAQSISPKGRIRTFDSIECLRQQVEEGQLKGHSLWVADFEKGGFVEAAEAAYAVSPSIRSPMGGSIAAFRSTQAARSYLAAHGGELVDWALLPSLGEISDHRHHAPHGAPRHG